MDKEITIIELLNENPYKFKWKDSIYVLKNNEYVREIDNWKPYFYLEQLNDRVEIIEEEEKR